MVMPFCFNLRTYFSTKTIEEDIPSIGVTCHVAKLKGFTPRTNLPSILADIRHVVSFRREKHGASLAYLLYIMLQDLDIGHCAIRLFFAVFRKGFDLIDDKILIETLSKFY